MQSAQRYIAFSNKLEPIIIICLICFSDNPDLSPPDMQEVQLQVLTYQELVPKLIAARGPLEWRQS